MSKNQIVKSESEGYGYNYACNAMAQRARYQEGSIIRVEASARSLHRPQAEQRQCLCQRYMGGVLG